MSSPSAEWWIDEPSVRHRLESGEGQDHWPATPGEATSLVETKAGDRWLEVVRVATAVDGPAVTIPVPPRFGEMQRREPAVALAWREATRDAFIASFAAGQAVVGFRFDREQGGGVYCLAARANPEAS